MSCTDRKTEFRGQKDSCSGSDFDRKAGGRHNLREILADGFDDLSTPHPKTDADAHPAEEHQVDGRVVVLANVSIAPNHEDGDKWTDCVAEVKAKEAEDKIIALLDDIQLT